LSNIRVRRSGLITFAIRLGSTITGLVFVVMVTTHLSESHFGLWQLISDVIGYVIFAGNILYFWTIRYRARGSIVGKTVIFGAVLFSIVLSFIYIFVSAGAASSVSAQGAFSQNFYYFLISLPQVSLYIFSGVLEAILWGSAPERASFGFGIFELTKVAIGAIAILVLHLSLTGAILAVMGAQVVQIFTIVGVSKGEFIDKISIAIISKMVKTGWLALMNRIRPLVINFDSLIVAVITGSTIPLALYGAAFTYSAIITYSNWIAYGLYAGVLGGVDPKKAASRVFELQYLFIAPMVVGEIVLAYRLLHLFNAVYTEAIPILLILTIASAFSSMSLTFDNLIIAVDSSDATANTSFSFYAKSKLFLIAKIDLIISVAYLVSVSALTELLTVDQVEILGFQRYVFIGIIWAICALGMWTSGTLIKLRYVRKITALGIHKRTVTAIILGTAAYAAVLDLLSKSISIPIGEIAQAGYILMIGTVAIAVYAVIILSISESVRSLAQYTLSSLMTRKNVE
jgi:O-antigen/teichoic acid export membrane protein